MRLRGQIKKIIFGYMPGISGSFPYFGTKVYFPHRSWLFHLVCKYGIYESKNIELLQRLVKPNTVYLDVGANIGLMAIPILKNCPSCKVISFEPSPNATAYLEKTVNQSIYKERWNVVSKAISHEIGTIDFCIASSEFGAFDGLHDTNRAGVTQKITVPTTTIDTEWRAMGCPQISVIKIDIEGAELFALKGALQCIRQEHPSVLVEWSNHNLPAYNLPPTALLDFARDINYQIFSVNNLLEINNSTILRLEMQKTESFLLVPSQ